MGQRGRYWTCSKFANWILKTAGAQPKPKSATSKGWREWTTYNTTNHPIAYWIADTGLDYLQNVVYWPSDKFDDFRAFVRARFIRRRHLIKTGLPRTGYLSPDEKMLHGMFAVLVEFVETEVAYDEVAWGGHKGKNVPWWIHSRLTHWPVLRSRELGMKRLEWEATLDGPEVEDKSIRQAVNARETIALYTWWKDVRPFRIEPGVLSGYDALLENWDGELFDDVLERTRPSRKEARELEQVIVQQYLAEDTAMMTRLIKLRTELWT
jgi:hypothetical protein